MTCAQGNGVGRAGEVEVLGRFRHGRGQQLLSEAVDLFQGFGLELVDADAYFFLCFGGYGAELVHQFADHAFLAEILDAQGFQFLVVTGFQLCHFIQEVFYF